MKSFTTVRVEITDRVMNLTLDRPEVHNAFNDELLSEMIDLFEDRGSMEGLRAIVLRSDGKNFCAGADLNWMAEMVDYSREENVRDSSALAKMFAVMNESPVPLIGRVQGAAIGGGVGIVSICDVVVAERQAVFGLSEVKLGILPAVISPYVIRKIGESHARALFLTGERFGSERALRIGLVHHVEDGIAGVDGRVEKLIGQLKTSGPEAVRACKTLIEHVAHSELSEAIPYTIEAIAERRVSAEGQEGMSAFLEKKTAPWVER